MKRENIIEYFLLVTVIVSVIAVPIVIPIIDRYYQAHKFPKDAQVITLYGVAKGGIWTQERVTSFNYWWKKFKRAEEIPIRDNDTPVFFRVTSSDVLHSFAIPLYRIGPYDIKPGEFTDIELKTERDLRDTGFLCWQYCDKDHQHMKGRLVVLTEDEEKAL